LSLFLLLEEKFKIQFFLKQFKYLYLLIKMSKEYEGHIISTQPFYSNLNYYGSPNSCKSIIAPIPVETYPTVFSELIPHSLPNWMNPNHHQTKTNLCDSYNVFSKQQEQCDRFK
jgi:hypothetical protein